MPFELYDSIRTSQDGLDFMKQHFPDAIPIFGEADLLKQFGPGTLPGLPMISVKTSPHTVEVNDLHYGNY